MGIFDKFGRRASVMGKMAETVGVDFAEQVARNPAMASTYREAVMRCVHCTHDGACKSWMAKHPQAAHAPDYCRNKDLLERLAGE
ncbi:DUF6455 family protein [Thalassobius sp. S69A]|uniref:DUF6455 family protein n=1 Tax=unclassified Thalassovita TaxID=2619711 RepID=UPI000C0CEA0D|nr:hypothetical protein [Paracoccaceae bacterium]MBT24975.1 hypothetical protein [Paracoccaceae bacterium]